MEKQKYTSGPWGVSIGPPEHLRHGKVMTRIIPAVDTGRDFIIATCEHGIYGPRDEKWQSQAEANAALIASAPDLLEAAQDALQSLERLPDVEGAYRVTCITQLRAAIRKATGEPL